MALHVGTFLLKVIFMIWLQLAIRWTLPRFRFDQLMRLAWKGLIPMSLGVLLVAYLVDRLREGGFTLFDTQFITPHLASLGAIEIPRQVIEKQDHASAQPPGEQRETKGQDVISHDAWLGFV